MLRTGVAITAIVGTAAFAFVGPTQAGPEFKNKYPSDAHVHECGGDNTITYFGPLTMWPPNHKIQPVAIEGEDGDGGTVMLALEVVSNQADNAQGDGNTTGDIETPQGDTHTGAPAHIDFGLRSERSGLMKEGRTYTIMAQAQFDDDPMMCTATYEVTVPHDMRDKNSR